MKSEESQQTLTRNLAAYPTLFSSASLKVSVDEFLDPSLLTTISPYAVTKTVIEALKETRAEIVHEIREKTIKKHRVSELWETWCLSLEVGSSSSGTKTIFNETLEIRVSFFLSLFSYGIMANPFYIKRGTIVFVYLSLQHLIRVLFVFEIMH